MKCLETWHGLLPVGNPFIFVMFSYANFLFAEQYDAASYQLLHFGPQAGEPRTRDGGSRPGRLHDTDAA